MPNEPDAESLDLVAFTTASRRKRLAA